MFGRVDRVDGRERTNSGFLADGFGGLGQILDGILVVAEALLGAHIGAVVEFGGINTVHSGGLVELGLGLEFGVLLNGSITYSTVKVAAAHLSSDASDEDSGSNEGTHLEVEAFLFVVGMEVVILGKRKSSIFNKVCV